jgi:hypothetical protein
MLLAGFYLSHPLSNASSLLHFVTNMQLGFPAAGEWTQQHHPPLRVGITAVLQNSHSILRNAPPITLLQLGRLIRRQLLQLAVLDAALLRHFWLHQILHPPRSPNLKQDHSSASMNFSQPSCFFSFSWSRDSQSASRYAPLDFAGNIYLLPSPQWPEAVKKAYIFK